MPAARIVLGRGPLAGQVALPLDVDGRVIGRLELMGAGREVLDDEIAQRVARSLAGVLALAQERERLAHAEVEAQALRASDALKTALLRAVSHELRTPLTAIKAAVGALRGDQVQLGEEAVRELLEDVSIETDRLDRLVSDLLDVSRLQAGTASTALDWCEVDDLVRGAVAAARSRAPGTTLEIETDEELPLVHCDATQIERVLVNLIENAAKFSPAGRAGRAARARDRRRPRGDLGHRPRARHRAGSAGARLRAVLPRARRRRRRHGTRSRDRARIRRGQRRHADDRRCSRGRHVHAHRAAEHEGQRGGSGVSGSGARVLVVDDERAIQRALKATLEAAGYHVDVVGTCADALAQVALKPPDLVLLDLLLPDGTGDEVAREIRTWSNVPILLVSAVGDEREKVKALDAGADDYVTKPFGIDELLARVRAMLRRAVDRPRPDAVVELGDLRVDLARRRVTRDDDEIHLTPIEYDLLRTLVAHPGKVLTHKAIIQEVWGPGYGESHLLRVHIAALRRKIERDPREPELIETVTGVGYRIREPEPREPALPAS